MAEHWFCKPEVVGSNPTASFACRNECPDQAKRHAADDLKRLLEKERRTGIPVRPFTGTWVGYLPGQMAERPMAPDCKSGGLSPTQVRILLCPIACVAHKLSGMETKLWVGKRGCSSMVEHRSSKPITRVRFPSPAWAQSPRTAVRGLADRCCSSAVERVLGKDEVLGSSPSSSSWKRTKFHFRFDSWNLVLGIWFLEFGS
jgi:hypothetical protein